MKRVELTENEVKSIQDFIELYLFDAIRTDTDIDSPLWLYNILNVYKKCGGFEQFADWREDEE